MATASVARPCALAPAGPRVAGPSCRLVEAAVRQHGRSRVAAPAAALPSTSAAAVAPPGTKLDLFSPSKVREWVCD
jgi:hypothetical protein